MNGGRISTPTRLDGYKGEGSHNHSRNASQQITNIKALLGNSIPEDLQKPTSRQNNYLQSQNSDLFSENNIIFSEKENTIVGKTVAN